ncbi:hypothetical protein [Calothrix sp. UHCC 0171]|uniref:hypothetical protein n=1 Tax=Calothrix sp. UHCC 0171 TaxID=3110245 RepID=UPI002B2110C2|nr:hypothetical protein [Calothrix sp. UHCC 0171]MEA5572813.1 hypothetical protein [Calothrix sp. UHCC 0171]
MEPNQKELRTVANQEFIEALNQLGDILQESPPDEEEAALVEIQPEESSESESDQKFDLAAWEDAVADIEKYLENRTSST